MMPAAPLLVLPRLRRLRLRLLLLLESLFLSFFFLLHQKKETFFSLIMGRLLLN